MQRAAAMAARQYVITAQSHIFANNIACWGMLKNLSFLKLDDILQTMALKA